MIIFRTKWKRWEGKTALVIGSGPSLKHPTYMGDCKVIAVNDAYKIVPEADILYACDEGWWKINHDTICETFKGERWSSHSSRKLHDDKLSAANKYDLWLVGGARAPGFCLTGNAIHYGGNSGFQAINLALMFGVKRVLLLGFDMQADESKKAHFFGNHDEPLFNNFDFNYWINLMNEAASLLPPDIQIINCSEQTALTCFPRMSLREALDTDAQIAA